MRFLIISILGIWFCGASAQACDVTARESARVTTVIDAVTFDLADGRTLRLEGLGPPRAPSRHAGPWPLMGEAADEVRELIGAGQIEFAPTGEPDRYGRVIAQVWLPGGTWLNGALVERGLARVETTPHQRRCASEALAREAEARMAGRGMWRLSAYEVRDALEASAFTNDFQIVEGRVVDAAAVRGRVYLNFGTDWRTDFTVTIAPSDVRRFEDAGLDPLSWEGRRLRARGWLEWYNGPMIEASHPEQIELLAADDVGGAREDLSDE
jgi:endonuclease YncB( thermonuclease family)